jgi:hypothetical protein
LDPHLICINHFNGHNPQEVDIIGPFRNKKDGMLSKNLFPSI